MTAPRKTTAVWWNGTEFEYRCPVCQEFWPLTREFYNPAHGMARCNACWREYQVHWQRRHRADPDVAIGIRGAQRAKAAANRDRMRENQRRWREANREHCRQWQREWREKNRQKVKDYAAFHRGRAA